MLGGTEVYRLQNNSDEPASQQAKEMGIKYLIHQHPRSVPLLQILLRAVKLPRAEHASTNNRIVLESSVNGIFPYARYSSLPFSLFFRSGVTSTENDRGQLHLRRRGSVVEIRSNMHENQHQTFGYQFVHRCSCKICHKPSTDLGCSCDSQQLLISLLQRLIQTFSAGLRANSTSDS